MYPAYEGDSYLQKEWCQTETNVFNLLACIFLIIPSQSCPRVLSPFRGWEIAYLSDPDSYAGWSFYTPVRATQARQVEG